MMPTRTVTPIDQSHLLEMILALLLSLVVCAATLGADLSQPTSPDRPLAGSEVAVPAAAESAQPRFLGFLAGNSLSIGNTWYDMQQNGSMGFQIVVGNGWVHNVWNYLPGASNSNRNSRYFAWQIGGPGVRSQNEIDPVTGGGGFSSIGFDPTGAGAPVVTYHRLSDNLTRAARDTGSVVASFRTFSFSGPGVNCQNIVSGLGTTDGPYLWPKIALDISSAGQGIAHIVSTEYRPAEVKTSLVYYRTNAGITAPAATCATWIDSVTVVGAVVVQDPNSDDVAIVYPAPADWAHADAIQQRNNDVVYKYSTNLGVNWSPAINITNFTGADDERAYTDLNALYTSDGCLQIVWTTSYFDSATAQVGNQGARLYHWSDCSQCQTLLIAASNSEPACKRGIWNKNVSKMALSECIVGGLPRLYTTYTYFRGDDASAAPHHDCSQAGFANGELFAQVSQNGGASWGPPVNLTNTMSDNCAAGACMSEHWSSAAPYVTDSLRLQYILDKDPGAVAYSEGTWTLNEVMNLSHPCFATESYSHLVIEPTEFRYPLHTAPGQQLDTFLVLTNTGNAVANYTRGINFQHGANWLVFPNHPPNGSVPVGCINLDTLEIRLIGPAAEGFYQANVAFTYSDGDSEITEQIPFDLYNFATFFQPQNFALRTAVVRAAVNQAGRVGCYSTGNQFTFFSGGGLSYLRDASLILGTSRNSLSWLIFSNGGGTPTAANPYGSLYAVSALTVDSTGSPAYRRASGKGVNRDSTIGFNVRYYAAKDAGNSEFLLARFDFYLGPHNSTGRIDDLTVGFAADWDVPSDNGFDNLGGGFDSHQLVYQQGTATPPNSSRLAGLAVLRVDGTPAPGGFVWEDSKYVVPLRVYQVDSLWNKMNGVTKFESSPLPGDLNSVVVGGIHESLVGTGDTLSLIFILAGQLNGTTATLKAVVDKALFFNCQHVSPDQVGCPEYVCGDADGSQAISISDAVYLINYIFAGGPPPNPVLAGDADCSHAVSISDAVYLINYIFAGGQTPCANCK